MDEIRRRELKLFGMQQPHSAVVNVCPGPLEGVTWTELLELIDAEERLERENNELRRLVDGLVDGLEWALALAQAKAANQKPNVPNG